MTQTPLTWNGRKGVLSNADYNLHLAKPNGASFCGYQSYQLRAVTKSDFKANGELRRGEFCQTCREQAAEDLKGA
jgi:hypothetical protein